MFADLVKKMRGGAYEGKGRRTGTPGHYQYDYDEPKARQLSLFDAPVEKIVEAAKRARGDQEYVHHVAIDPEKPWTHPDWTPDLETYDHILVNTSAGKDSQAQLDRIVQLCDERGISRDRIIAVHADLGQVEWEKTKDLAKEQAEAYGVRFEWVERKSGDLLEQVRDRHHRLQQRQLDVQTMQVAGISTWKDLAGTTRSELEGILGDKSDKYPRAFDSRVRARQLIPKSKLALRDGKGDEEIDFGEPIPWPSSQARYCTSDQKTAPITQWINNNLEGVDGEKPRILNCLGIRAQESPARKKKTGFVNQVSNSKRHTDKWFPIFGWSEKKVWDTIAESEVPWHGAYAKGMKRLSCVFCVFAPKAALVIAAKHNPELFQQYLELEREVGYDFSPNTSLREVAEIIRQKKEDQAKGLGLASPSRELDLVQIRSLAKALGVAADLDLAPLSDALTVAMGALYGQATVVVDWKDRGCCIHLVTQDEDHHIAWFDEGAQANAASLLAMAVAADWSVDFEEFGQLPPVE